MWRMAGVGLISMAMVTLSGCGGGLPSQSSSANSGSLSNPTIVTITPASASVYEGATLQFAAKVTGQSNQAVTWSLGQGGVGAIDGTGLYTAPIGTSGGPVYVVAASQVVPTAKGSASVMILAPSVTITPASVTVAPGGTQTFAASVAGLADAHVIWSVQEAAGGSVNNVGFYNAPQAAGFYHAVATSAADTTISASATITVTTSTGRFTPTDSMQQGRSIHTGTLLADGKVLVAGGATRWDPLCIGGMAAAEIYDPAAGSFRLTGNMTAARYAHTATLLPSGEVLITGGYGSGFDCEDLGESAQSSAELYNPSTGSFAAIGTMAQVRAGHTATLLQNGKVLVVGGGSEGGSPYSTGVTSATAELYDPVTHQFAFTGSMATPRAWHSATLLPNGDVLIVGGIDAVTSQSATTAATAEIYDTAAGVFTVTGSMANGRRGHTATLLTDGRVLIAGGNDLATAELYDYKTGSFSPTGVIGIQRSGHTATLLPSGMVLIAGGSDSTAELYDPSTGLFGPTGGMEIGRSRHSAVLLQDGKVLVTGGGTRPPLASAELYQP